MSGYILFSGLDLTTKLYHRPAPAAGPGPASASGDYSGPAINWDSRSVVPADLFDNGNPIYVHFTGSPLRRAHLSRCNDGASFGTRSAEVVGAQESLGYSGAAQKQGQPRRRRLAFKSLQRKCEVSEEVIGSWIYMVVGGVVACLVCWVLRGEVPVGDKGFSQVVVPLVPVECVYLPGDLVRQKELHQFFYESGRFQEARTLFSLWKEEGTGFRRQVKEESSGTATGGLTNATARLPRVRMMDARRHERLRPLRRDDPVVCNDYHVALKVTRGLMQPQPFPEHHRLVKMFKGACTKFEMKLTIGGMTMRDMRRVPLWAQMKALSRSDSRVKTDWFGRIYFKGRRLWSTMAWYRRS